MKICFLNKKYSLIKVPFGSSETIFSPPKNKSFNFSPIIIPQNFLKNNIGNVRECLKKRYCDVIQIYKIICKKYRIKK